MSLPGEWIRRLGYLLRRGAMEEELRREMDAHRAQLADPRAFGNTLRLRDEARDAWGWGWLDDLTQDVRFAARTLRRSPGFTATAIVTLALGIGVNSGMFGLVNSLLLRPLYDRPGAVVSVFSRSGGAAGGMQGISYPDFVDLRDGTAAVFEHLAAAGVTFAGVDAGDGARRTLAAGVTGEYFAVVGSRLALGRTFTADEARPGAMSRVAILSYPLWQRRGGTPDIIGRTVRVNGDPFTVIGVTARGFTGTGIPGPDVWLPIDALVPVTARDAPTLDAIGRLRDGVGTAALAPALAAVAHARTEAFPATGGYTLDSSEPNRLLFMPGRRSAAMTTLLAALLMALPAIVLLVACLNLADLLLARSHVRRQELAIRASLGGSRGRLTRQLLTEGLLLSFAGGLVGLWLSTTATRAMLTALHGVLPAAVMLPEVTLDWRVLAGTVAFSLFASAVFGAWPAWTATGRAAIVDLKRQAGDGGRRPRGIGVGNALVVVQVACSLLLLATAGLFLKSALAAVSVDPGFRVERGILADVDPALAGYDDDEARRFHLGLVERVRRLAGVETVSIASAFPFSSFGDSRLVAAAGTGGQGRAGAVDSVFTVVGRDYAPALGLPLAAGRDFTAAELESAAGDQVAIVDDALAERLWPGESAIGRLIEFADADSEPRRPLRVVGLMPAVKHSLGAPRPFPHVYVPLGQFDEIEAMSLMVRAAPGQDESALLTAIARAVRDADERVPVLGLQNWRSALDSSLDVSIFRAGALVCGLFGVIALLLAVIGVCGVKSYVVSRRTREFGIRIAAGAAPRTLLWQVLLEGGRITALGIVIGLGLAVGAGYLLQGLLYGVRAVEPAVLAAAPLILFAASLVASVVPAVRATRVDPTVALRAE
jgi:predicted permease